MSGSPRKTATVLLLVLVLVSSCASLPGGTPNASRHPFFAASVAMISPPLADEEERSHPFPTSAPQSRSTQSVASPMNIADDLSVLNGLLTAFVLAQEGQFGVYVIDLVTGEHTGVNMDQPFRAASTFKLPVAMYLLDQVGQGLISLEEKVEFQEDDREEGAGILHLTLPGDSFTIAYLIEVMIVHSDNIALKMLLRHFDRANVYAYMRHLGGSVLFYDAESWGTTPREMGDYLHAVYNGQGLSDPAQGAWLLEVLSKTTNADRIAAGVPPHVRVAHKVGTLHGVVNDVGLVFASQRPFLLSVLSEGADMGEAPQAISDLTRLVYTFLNGLGGPLGPLP